MKQIAHLILAITFASCGNNTYICTCAIGDKTVGTYKIEASKEETASFECGQKELQFSGNPEFDGIKCTVKAEK